MPVDFAVKKTVLIFLLLLSALINYAQDPLQDSINNQAEKNVLALYQNSMKENLRLYNGREYQFSGHNAKGFPYFKSGDILNGSVFYDGNLYTDVNMYYDIVNDELVINDYTKNFPIRLITDKVKYFAIDGNKFVNLAIDESLPVSSTKGFYEELYSNKTIVFAKKQKILKEKTSLEGSDFSYIEFDYYFIYSGNNIYKVNNEKSVLDVFKKRRTELRKFISANKIDFRKDFEQALVKTAQYFDEFEN